LQGFVGIPKLTTKQRSSNQPAIQIETIEQLTTSFWIVWKSIENWVRFAFTV